MEQQSEYHQAEQELRDRLEGVVAVAGQQAVCTVADLGEFGDSLVGRWRSLAHFVECLVIETDMERQLDRLPASVRPFAVIDRRLVASNVQHELVVIEQEDSVWIFDPRRFHNDIGVAESER